MKKLLVIIGGGFAGANISKNLENYFDTTLIDEKNYFEFTPGILRSIIYPEHLKRININHNSYLKKSKVVKGRVVRLNNKSIFLENKKEIKYDYLVICSGSRYESPVKDRDIIIASRGKNLMKYHNSLSKAKNVLIIGGGLVGVELAGEILSRYNNKTIKIIHSKERIIQRNNIQSVLYAEKFLMKNNVAVTLNETAVKNENSVITTNKNNHFNYDIAFFCTGIKPNSDFVGRNKLDANGFIKVDKSLRMKEKNNIFVCGDVASINEEKTAQAAEKHSNIVINNLIATEKRKRLKEYTSKKRPFSISLGLYDGIFEYNNFIITGIVAAFIKKFIEIKIMIRYKL